MCIRDSAPGAFSGARNPPRPFLLLSSNFFTLFLDEIGDMPHVHHALLLRVLQEREVVPVGGGAPVPVDFVLVCATHRNLKSEMEAGRFRADLYYRINGLTLILPSLRERSDFSSLTARMLKEMAPERDVSLSDSIASSFAQYAWPGTLRPLANALRTACALLDEDETQVSWQHLPDDLVEEFKRPAPWMSGAVEVCLLYTSRCV